MNRNRQLPASSGAMTRFFAACATQDAKNLVMDLEDVGCRARFIIRDRDGEVPRPVRRCPQGHGDRGRPYRQFEEFYNSHRPHQGIANARPLHPLPTPIDDPNKLSHLNTRRHDRLGGILPEYRHAA